MTRDNQDINSEMEELRREVIYLRRLAERSAGYMMKAEIQATAIRRELEQKRLGFSLMAELAVALGHDADYEDVLISVSRRINTALNMQRTAVLVPYSRGIYRAAVLQGYTSEERETLESRHIEVAAELLDPFQQVLVTGADPDSRLESFRRDLMLPYFISAPVYMQNDAAAILVTGRLAEKAPFLLRLGQSDAETVQTVSSYMAAMITGHRLAAVENLANLDPLTQLPNLRRAKEGMRQIISLAKRGGFFSAVMFLDLDGFKAINDNYGHAAGDHVLRVVAERLGRSARESDMVARIGGDEFVVVLSHVTRHENAGHVAGKLIEKLGQPISLRRGISVKIGCSIGIAIFPEHGSDANSLLKAADEAMYTVKNRGKNNFAFYTGKKT